MNDKHGGATPEAINDQLKVIREGLAAMASVPSDIAEIKTRLTTVESGMEIIKAAIKDHSRVQYEHDATLDDHKTRIGSLEPA